MEPAREMLELASGEEFCTERTAAAMDQLKAMFPTHVQQDTMKDSCMRFTAPIYVNVGESNPCYVTATCGRRATISRT